MAANGVLDFQSTNKLIFRGANANVVIDTQNLSLGVGHQGEGAITSNLFVTGNAHVSTDLSVGTSTLFVDSVNDRIGIGKTDPAHPLDIKVTSQASGLRLRYNDDGAYMIISPDVSLNGYNNISESGDMGIFFSTDATTASNETKGFIIAPHVQAGTTSGLKILENGNVGVGTNSPNATLDVNGAATFSGDVAVDTINPYSMLHLGSDTAGSGGRAKSGNMTASDYYLLLGRVEYGVAKEWRIGFGYNSSATNVPPSYIGYHERVNSSGTKGDLVFGGRHTDNAGIQATERMRITYDGCVGIRNTTPDCPLHVSGQGGTNTGASIHRGFRHDYDLRTWTNNHNNVGIFADDDIMCHGFFLSIDGTFGASDRRIKKDIVDIDDGAALQTLIQLQPKQYKYIDTYRKTSDPVWGFIAQEVRETLPHSTQFRTEFIPDITEVATVSESTMLTFTNFDTSNLEIGKKLRVHDQNHAEHKIKVAAIIDAHSVRVEEDLSGWTCSFNEDGTIGEGNSLYVFGREVDDFVFIKKDAIWTVATAALQEVDRQLQAEKAKVTTLESQLASVLTRLDALENA